jgi:hypothetical protein
VDITLDRLSDPSWWADVAGVNPVVVILIVVLSQYVKVLGLPRGWPRRVPPLVLSGAAGFGLASAGAEPSSVLPEGAPFAVRALALAALHLGAALAVYWLGEERLRKLLPSAFRGVDTAVVPAVDDAGGDP